MKSAVVLTAFLAFTSPAAADLLKPQLRTTVFGRSPIIDETQRNDEPDVVIFTDETVRFQVKLAWRDASVVPDAALSEWWRDVHVHVTSDDGMIREFSTTDLELAEARTKGRRVAGQPGAVNTRPLPDATFAIFDLGPLPPGDYRLKATMHLIAGREYNLTAPEATFAIWRGDEDDYARRLYLHKRADATRSFEEFKAVQLELLKFEPRNTAIFEAIAERSLNNAPAAETREWYRRAHETRFRNAEEFKARRGGDLTAEEQAHIAADLARLSVFEQIYDTYVARSNQGVRLVPFQYGREKTYAWEDQAEGTLAVIDLRNPQRTHRLQQ